jgi:adenine-specific DNA-methyltransferase
MIRYLGSKKTLIPEIIKISDKHFKNSKSMVDLFSGTTRVAQAYKKKGLFVHSNDVTNFAHDLGNCYIAADKKLYVDATFKYLENLTKLEGYDGWFSELYCDKAPFFRHEHGRLIQAQRDYVETLNIDEIQKSILITAIIEAADGVANCMGQHMAYLKEWSKIPNYKMEMPALTKGIGLATKSDALVAASNLKGDFVYMDPPYNQHKYNHYYHIWETISLWDSPATYGVAHRRLDCQEPASPFNYKASARDSLEQLISRTSIPNIMLSFNDEGYISLNEIRDILQKYGTFVEYPFEYKRHISGQLGIYNHDGEIAGEPSGKLTNFEYVFVLNKSSL